MEIPTLVPTLTKQEIDYLLSGQRPTRAIVDKAVQHARQRMSQGLSPFKELEQTSLSPEIAKSPAISNLFQEPGISLAGLDLRGLDPEDVGKMLGQSLGIGQLEQRRRESEIARRTSQEQLAQATETNRLKRIELKQKKEQKEAEIARTAPEDKLKKDKLSAEIKKLDKQTLKLEKEIAEKPKAGLTEYQRISLKNQGRRIANAELQEEGAKQRDILGMEEDIMEAPGAGENIPLIDYINKTQDKPYFYIQYDKDAGDLIDFSPDVKGDRLALPNIGGRQMTMDMVRRGAEAAGISVEEYLAHPSIGVLKKVNGNYVPVD